MDRYQIQCFPTRRFGSWIAIVVSGFILLFCATEALAQQQHQEDNITLNFVDSNLEDVVKGISVITGKRFLLPPNLKSKKINLVTRQPISVRRVYGVLLSALRSYRLVATENDGIISIVPETEAWPQVKPIQPKSHDSNLVSKVIKLKSASAAVVANIIRPLLSQKGFPLVPNNSNNSLVIVDYAQNIRNLETIIASLDQTEHILPVVFPITHLSAIEADSAIKKMLNSAPLGSVGGYTKPVSENIYADIPNNRLLVRANTKQLVYIAKLLAFIDVPRKSARLIHVYALKYTNAERIAKTLRNLLSTSSQTSKNQASTTNTSSAQNTAQTTSSQENPIVESMFTLDKSGISIQADAATNSLVIVAPENLYRNLVEIIQKLDVRRQQLFVEILIADVNGNRLNELGVQWMAANPLDTNQKGVIATTRLDNPSIADVASNPLNMGGGLNIGVINGQINIPGVGEILNLGMLARALETRANAKILSSPNLLVLNNEESKLLVGSTIPVVTGQYTQTSGTSNNPFQTIERKDVGVTLRIKPQIMDSGAILLDLYQEVSDILSVTPQGPTTSKRSIESKIMLDDGQVMVLGGLISEKINDNISRVPVLGQIPILGRLFTYSKKTHSKSNLMLFIRPTILQDANSVSTLSRERYQRIYDQQHTLRKDLQGLLDHPSDLLPAPKSFVVPKSPGSSDTSTSPGSFLNVDPNTGPNTGPIEQPHTLNQNLQNISDNPPDSLPASEHSIVPPSLLLEANQSPDTPDTLNAPPKVFKVISYSINDKLPPSSVSSTPLPIEDDVPSFSDSDSEQLESLQPIFFNTVDSIEPKPSEASEGRLQKMRDLYIRRKAKEIRP